MGHGRPWAGVLSEAALSCLLGLCPSKVRCLFRPEEEARGVSVGGAIHFIPGLRGGGRASGALRTPTTVPAARLGWLAAEHRCV